MTVYVGEVYCPESLWRFEGKAGQVGLADVVAVGRAARNIAGRNPMAPPRSEGFVRMPEAKFEAIRMRGAEEGAKRVLADVGLDGDKAALNIRDLRSLADCNRLVRRTAMQTAARMTTTGVMLALPAGIAIKLKIFGGSLMRVKLGIDRAAQRPGSGPSGPILFGPFDCAGLVNCFYAYANNMFFLASS